MPPNCASLSPHSPPSPQLNADVAFSSSTTIEAIGATQIALSHVHENKKGGSKDSYLLDASTAAASDAWMLAFKALHQLACNAQTSTPPPSPGHGVSSSPQVRCALHVSRVLHVFHVFRLLPVLPVCGFR